MVAAKYPNSKLSPVGNRTVSPSKSLALKVSELDNIESHSSVFSSAQKLTEDGAKIKTENKRKEVNMSPNSIEGVSSIPNGNGNQKQLTRKMMSKKSTFLDKADAQDFMSITGSLINKTHVRATSVLTPYLIQIKITNVKQLLQNTLTKKPKQVCLHSKDSNFDIVGQKYILASQNKNAILIDMETGNQLKELKLKQREMSSSIELGNFLIIGTYVDSIAVFDIEADFKLISSVRVRDSVISMCIMSLEQRIIAVGCASGQLDFIKIVQREDGQFRGVLIKGT